MLQKVSCIADFCGPNYAFKNYLGNQKLKLKQKPLVIDFKTVFAKEMAK